MRSLRATPSPLGRRRGPAIVFLTAVGWLTVVATGGLLVLLWRYTMRTESGTPWLGYLFSGVASLLLCLVLVIAAVGAIQVWRGHAFGLHSMRVLVSFGGFVCTVMLIKGIYALVSDAPKTPPAALVCYAIGVCLAAAFNALLSHDSVTSWCASERAAATDTHVGFRSVASPPSCCRPERRRVTHVCGGLRRELRCRENRARSRDSQDCRASAGMLCVRGGTRRENHAVIEPIKGQQCERQVVIALVA